MRFFSNEAKENTDSPDYDDSDRPDHVASDPVAVPQQRAGSPWSDAPGATDAATDADTARTPDDSYVSDSSDTAVADRTDDADDLRLDDSEVRHDSDDLVRDPDAVYRAAAPAPEHNDVDVPLDDHERDSVDTLGATTTTYGPDGTVITTDEPAETTDSVDSDSVDPYQDVAAGRDDLAKDDADVVKDDSDEDDVHEDDVNKDVLHDEGDLDSRLDSREAVEPVTDEPVTDEPLDSTDTYDAQTSDVAETSDDEESELEPVATDTVVDDTVVEPEVVDAYPVAAEPTYDADTTDDSDTTTDDTATDADVLPVAAVPAPAADTADQLPGSVESPTLDRLFADGDSFSERFRDVQLRFVDSPKEATDAAAALVGEAVDKLTSALKSQKDSLASNSEDTEQLRVELRAYRDMLNRLTSL